MTKRVVALRITDSVLDEVKDLAKALNVNMSDVMRIAIRHGLRELKIRMALDKYVHGKISLERFAELTGLSYWEALQEIRRRGFTLNYPEEDIF